VGVVVTNQQLKLSAEHKSAKNKTYEATNRSVVQYLQKVGFGPKVSKVLPTTSPVVTRSSLSTNSGLKHIHLACEGACGSFDLVLGSDSRSVIFTLRMPALLLQARPATTDVAIAIRPESSGAVDKDIEDSPGATQMLVNSEQFIRAPAPPPELSVNTGGLKVCALDDSQVMN